MFIKTPVIIQAFELILVNLVYFSSILQQFDLPENKHLLVEIPWSYFMHHWIWYKALHPKIAKRLVETIFYKMRYTAIWNHLLQNRNHFLFHQLSMIFPKIVLSHRNTIVKNVKSKEVNVVLIFAQILLLHTTWFYLVMWNWTLDLVPV